MVPTNILSSPSGQALQRDGDQLVSDDGRTYPIVDGVPVLLDADRSLFSADEVAGRAYVEQRVSPLRGLVRRLLPSMTLAVGTEGRYADFASRISSGRVLVIGGGRLGQGAKALIESGLEIIESDVYLSPRVAVVCDAHHLPFGDGTFDGIVLQAVLEHVLDPPRVVAEAHRVLKPEGLIYSETPFLQGVHEGAFDFTRFTELGHRRLFRMFTEIETGVVAGPATTLLWAIAYLARSLPRRRSSVPLILEKLATLAFFWLKYLDRILITHPGATDAASGVYFMGRRAAAPVDDRAILEGYRGAFARPIRRDSA